MLVFAFFKSEKNMMFLYKKAIKMFMSITTFVIMLYDEKKEFCLLFMFVLSLFNFLDEQNIIL